MKKEAINKEKFLKIIEKFLDNECTKEEEALIINFYESFQNDQEWHEEYGIEKEVKEIIHLRILNSISESELPQRKTKKLKLVWKYAAAASIAVLLATSLLLNFKNEISNKQPVLVESDIKIGTDKATLTLEDGSTVALENGKEYKNEKVSSDGEKIVYQSEIDKPAEKLAYNYLTIPRGGEFFIQLEDNTKVWLNAESKIKYPVAFLEGETREVELLYGEAYFEVSPSSMHNGAKFKVLTQGQEVVVLGTEFNIKAYKDENAIYTTLVEGKVAIDVNDRIEQLKPNEQSIFNKDNKDIVIYAVDVYSEISWKEGLFSFKDKSLKDIMKTLSRWYDVDVVFEDKALEEVRFKGVLNKNQNIEEILILIKNTNFIHAYDIKDNTILLRN